MCPSLISFSGDNVILPFIVDVHGLVAVVVHVLYAVPPFGITVDGEVEYNEYPAPLGVNVTPVTPAPLAMLYPAPIVTFAYDVIYTSK
jgi:hypothetical protein